jgi:hypothetical protein
VVVEKQHKNGRPRIADGEKTTVFAVRLTERQLQKVIRNGRSDWLRKLIEEAKE